MDVWADGEMSREGEGSGDGRRAAAFIPWKLILLFVSLPSDKNGPSVALVLSLFLHSPPSFNCDGFVLGKEESGRLLIEMSCYAI